MTTAERQTLTGALERHEWNITRSAKELGISRQHLHNRIRHHGLERPKG
ncbi:MAG: helix-turn-helix domain-containing protein [Candidatus Eisenbacteria bacterium]